MWFPFLPVSIHFRQPLGFRAFHILVSVSITITYLSITNSHILIHCHSKHVLVHHFFITNLYSLTYYMYRYYSASLCARLYCSLMFTWILFSKFTFVNKIVSDPTIFNSQIFFLEVFHTVPTVQCQLCCIPVIQQLLQDLIS